MSTTLHSILLVIITILTSAMTAPVQLIQHAPSIDYNLQPISTVPMFQISSCKHTGLNQQYHYQMLNISATSDKDSKDCNNVIVSVTYDEAELIIITPASLAISNTKQNGNKMIYEQSLINSTTLVDIILLDFSNAYRSIVDVSSSDRECVLTLVPRITGPVCHSSHVIKSKFHVKVTHDSYSSYPSKSETVSKEQTSIQNLEARSSSTIRNFINQMIYLICIVLITIIATTAFIFRRLYFLGAEVGDGFHVQPRGDDPFEERILQAQRVVATRLRRALQPYQRH